MVLRLRAAAMLALLAGACCYAAEPHTFVYKPEEAVKSVAVAGDFNGWSTAANPMKRTASGDYSVTLPLTEGVHYYKFVIDGGKWISDPKYSDKELEKGDNYGGVNSAVLVGPDARKLGPPKPNDVNLKAVLHSPTNPADVDVVDATHVRVRLRTLANDVQRVSITMRDGGLKRTETAPLYRVSVENGFDVYANLVEVPGPDVAYWFDLVDGTADIALDPDHFNVEVTPKFTTPDWAKDAVWYQIFPERFRNGDKSNDPPNVKRWQSDWYATLPGEAPGAENFYKGRGNVWQRRYGGDIQGIKEKLPYLKELGINAIYLNPIFEAESMHKYDATDYRHIDDNFGVRGDLSKLAGETDDPKTWKWSESDKVFLDFVAEAHRQGFKVVIDGVFNHVGRDFWAFQDVLRRGKSSPYAGWFDIRDWGPPVKYIAWDKGGEPTADGALPVFKKDERLGLVHGPREHIFAVTKRWLAPDGDPSRGVDGFRLDVPGDIPHPFWVEWRKLVKQTKPDAYIVGEIWDWAQPWLQGDQFDAVMNYRFADASQQFFVNQEKAMAPAEFASRLSEIVNAYPLQSSLAQMNLFDSHDTDRLASMFVNPNLPYDAKNRIQDNGPQYSPAKPDEAQWARMKQEIVFQMTFLGAPMIYYGDEAGMWGPDDPSNRMPMLWKDLGPYDDPNVTFKQDVFDHYKRLIALRRELKPLRWGYFRPVKADDGAGVLVFSRTLGADSVTVALNRSAEKHTITIPGKLPVVDRLNSTTIFPAGGTISVTLDPYGSAILAPKK